MKLRPLSKLATVLLFAGLCLGSSFKPGKWLESAGSYVCVETQAPDRILIGDARHPVKLTHLAGKPVLVKYDDEYVWVRPPHGRTIRLRQDYLTRAFVPGSPCEEVIEAAWKRLNAPPKKLLVRESH